MNFKEKRHAKKLARIFITLAYVVMIGWAVTILGGLIKAVTATGELNISTFLMFVIGVAPVIACLTLGFIGQRYVNQRVYYKEAIKEYRQCTFFTEVIRLVTAGDEDSFTTGIHVYNELITPDTLRRSFLYAFIIGASLYSGDSERVEKGNVRLNEILESYNPANVKYIN